MCTGTMPYIAMALGSGVIGIALAGLIIIGFKGVYELFRGGKQ